MHSPRRNSLKRLIPVVLLTLLLPLTSIDAAEWRTWNASATAQVRRNDTPVLLLITAGYCHTCREVVKTGAGTDFFLPLVLDQMERPELAAAYLAFAEGLTGEPVELPVAVALTPFLDPVAATGSVTPQSLQSFVTELESSWSREKFLETALHVRRLTLEGWTPAVPETPGQRLREAYVNLIQGNADETDFAGLRRMSETALYDQIGGGFHRAARDDAWTTPEFEKLLSDQALAVLVYTAAWQLTGEQRFATVATATADLILRQFLNAGTGLFLDSLGSHSLVPRDGAVMADGAHYVWDVSEIRHLLGDETAGRLLEYFGASEERTIPRALDRTGDLAGKIIFSIPEGAAAPSEELLAASLKLLDVRSNRPPPESDEAVLTSSTALAISALSNAGVVFSESRYSTASERALQSLIARNIAEGRLYASKAAQNPVPASMLDYALLVRAMLDVYESSFDPSHLLGALDLQRTAAKGVESDHVPEMLHDIEPVPVLEMIARLNLVQLGAASGETSWVELGSELDGIESDRHKVLILAGDRRRVLLSLLDVARETFRPHVLVLMVETTAELTALSPRVKGLEQIPACTTHRLGQRAKLAGPIVCTPVALVCRGGGCSAVKLDPAILRGILD